MNLCFESPRNYQPMEAVDDTIDPELEVQKLQDLVRKLERQNEILRTKQQEQNIQNQQNSQNNKDQLSISDIENVNSDKPVTKPKTRFTSASKDSTLAEYNACFYEPSKEELEILDLDNDVGFVQQDQENEENWLYQSPKALTPKQKSTSPYKWVREVFDDTPPPELDSVRKCLVYKLDEVTKGGRVSRSSSSHTLASLNSPISTPSTAIGESGPQTPQQPNNNNNNNPGVPTIKQPLIAGLGTRVNTDTFTRPKKNKDLRRASDFGEYATPLENNDVSPASSSSSSHNERPDRRQSDTSSLLQQNKKTLDVHALAKMQEESLRQSFSPLASPRRSMRKKGGFYLNQPNDSDSNISPSSQSSTRSSPSRQEADGMIPPPRKFSSASHASSTASLNSNGSNGSHGSTPPDSPYGSTQYLESSPHLQPQIQQQVPRRSLPNVRGLMNGLRPNASEPQLHRDRPNSPYASTTGRSSPKLRGPSSSGRTSPATGQKSPSMLRAPSAGQRAVSPTPKSGSGIPTPGRTGIPRPGSTTPRPGSGIPMARSSLSMTNPRARSVSPNPKGGVKKVASSMSSLPATALRGTRNYAFKASDESWKDGCF